MYERYVDKNNILIEEGDMLRFDNESLYTVIKKNKIYIQCITKDLPMFELNKIICDNKLSSAIKISKAFDFNDKI